MTKTGLIDEMLNLNDGNFDENLGEKKQDRSLIDDKFNLNHGECTLQENLNDAYTLGQQH